MSEIEFWPEQIYARLRAIAITPSVTTNDASPNRATRNPENRPIAAPATTATAMPAGMP